MPETTLLTRDSIASTAIKPLAFNEETADWTESYRRAAEFFQTVQRSCCPKEFPPYLPRNPLLQQLFGEHKVPDPSLPFWWKEGILNSQQARENPWLRDLLQTVTWAEMIEGKINEATFKKAREGWNQEQRKLVSSPKIGNMLNLLLVKEAPEIVQYRHRNKMATQLPFWWYTMALRSASYTGWSTFRFLAQSNIQEFTSGEFAEERLLKYYHASKKAPPKNASVETFIRQIFGEFPQVITRFNQRGAKASQIMRLVGDPYSIVTMSSRSPHWTSCQNPIQNDTHEMSHRLWANLLDPNMALLEMIDPSIEEGSNLVARAIIRVVIGQKREMLYLDFL
ncbi:MAG: hypothetical protein FWF06_06015, partial [Symbiobacteriaceae bacterium]|nr:hypothetical protein [Symbiobacteriaceae bacterium]